MARSSFTHARAITADRGDKPSFSSLLTGNHFRATRTIGYVQTSGCKVSRWGLVPVVITRPTA